jgi:hypothetical protein
MSSNKEEKDSIFDNNNENSKVKEQKSAAKDTTTIDITKAGSTSKDILDIIDTPDVAIWNKSTQINKGNRTEIVKNYKGEKEEEEE